MNGPIGHQEHDISTMADTGRVFLVVVDETEEMDAALRFASYRARNTGGRVALLYVTEPAEFEHWMFVGNLMREEAREEAEAQLHRHSATVASITGKPPVVHVRDGKPRDELFKLVQEEKDISILVLAASRTSSGPGPLVSAVTGKYAGKLRVPVTVVPGDLCDEELKALA